MPEKALAGTQESLYCYYDVVWWIVNILIIAQRFTLQQNASTFYIYISFYRRHNSGIQLP